MIKVSVIMPVYNTEQYVEPALRSILQQSLADIEVIVVDDGSLDNSADIVQKLALEDSRIHLSMLPSNGGQSVARNYGLSQAKGKYIYFMDSDDLLEQQALECCYNKCEAECLDFVLFESEVLTEDKATAFSFDYHYSDLEDKVYWGTELLYFLLDTGQFCVSPCMLFLNAELLKNWTPVFYPGIIHEDQLFVFKLYTLANRIGYIQHSFFKRRIRSSSTMTNKMSRRNRIGYQTVFEQLEFMSKGDRANIGLLVEKHRVLTLNAFLYTAWSLPLCEKIRFLQYCFRRKYIKYIQGRNLIIFLLKQLKK